MSDSALPGPTAPSCDWGGCVQPAVARVAIQKDREVVGQTTRIHPYCAEHVALHTNPDFLRGLWAASEAQAVIILPLEADEQP